MSTFGGEVADEARDSVQSEAGQCDHGVLGTVRGVKSHHVPTIYSMDKV